MMSVDDEELTTDPLVKIIIESIQKDTARVPELFRALLKASIDPSIDFVRDWTHQQSTNDKESIISIPEGNNQFLFPIWERKQYVELHRALMLHLDFYSLYCGEIAEAIIQALKLHELTTKGAALQLVLSYLDHIKKQTQVAIFNQIIAPLSACSASEISIFGVKACQQAIYLKERATTSIDSLVSGTYGRWIIECSNTRLRWSMSLTSLLQELDKYRNLQLRYPVPLFQLNREVAWMSREEYWSSIQSKIYNKSNEGAGIAVTREIREDLLSIILKGWPINSIMN